MTSAISSSTNAYLSPYAVSPSTESSRIIDLITDPSNPKTTECCSEMAIEELLGEIYEDSLENEPEARFLENTQCISCEDVELLTEELSMKYWYREEQKAFLNAKKSGFLPNSFDLEKTPQSASPEVFKYCGNMVNNLVSHSLGWLGSIPEQSKLGAIFSDVRAYCLETIFPDKNAIFVAQKPK